MEQLYPWLGDLNQLGMDRGVIGLICVFASVFCGAFIGVEREKRDKPAGLRTLTLICVGSTVFTLVSILVSGSKNMADPARIASQIVPGVGFLGAGAIIRSRGTITGLTTGASIWATAAVGVTIGAGYVIADLVFTMVIFLTLTGMQVLDRCVSGNCQWSPYLVDFQTCHGKSEPRLQAVIDQFGLEDSHYCFELLSEEAAKLRIEVCKTHREHRSILKEIAELEGVTSIRKDVPANS